MESGSGDMYAARVRPGTDFAFGPPQRLFANRGYVNCCAITYDIAKDGRFLMTKSTQASPSELKITAIAHWSEEVRKRLPAR